jgi:hypothetical protein
MLLIRVELAASGQFFAENSKKNAHWVSGRCHQGASTPFNIAVRGDTPQVDLQIFTIKRITCFERRVFMALPKTEGRVLDPVLTRVKGVTCQKFRVARDCRFLINLRKEGEV